MEETFALENTTPFVGVLTSYGKPYLFGLIRNAVENGKSPYVIVESNDAAVSYAHTFRMMYPSVKTTVVREEELKKLSDIKSNVFFIAQSTLLSILLTYFTPPSTKDIIDFTEHLFYLAPNRIPFDIQIYVNLRILEFAHFRGMVIPNVTLYGVNSQNFPPLKSKITIFDKHSEAIPINYQFSGKELTSGVLYEEMAKWVLRLHMETSGKTVVVVVPTRAEIQTFIGIIQPIETPRLYLHNIYDYGEWTIPKDRMNFTNIYVATDETLNLVMVPVDVVVDSGRAIVHGKALSGESTTYAVNVGKDVSLGRSTILQNKISGSEAGTFMIMSDRILDTENVIPQSISRYLLMLGQTELTPLDVFPNHPLVHTELITLQSYGALNPDYRTTALGKFLLDVPLSPGEGTVLWTYMQSAWVLGESCLPAMIVTSMISAFSLKDPYYVYPPFEEDIVFKERMHRKKFWTKFAGVDDIDTFLNIWFAIFADMETFDPTYDDLREWGRRNSIDGDRLLVVLTKVRRLQNIVQKYGFVCEKDAITPTKNAPILRKIYSKVYLLKRMELIDEGSLIYQSLSDQRTYTVYHHTSVNTVSVTEPPQIVAPLTDDTYVLVVVLFRQP